MGVQSGAGDDGAWPARVAGNRVFAATLAGDVYAIDTASGCVHWAFKATAGIRSGVTVGDANGVPAIFFGDRSAVMYALNAASGELLWKTRPVDQLLAQVTATPQFYKGVIYQGFSSLEESLGGGPQRRCCSFRAASSRSTPRLAAQSGKALRSGTGKGERQGAGPIRSRDLVHTHHR